MNSANKRKLTKATAEVEQASPTWPKGPTSNEFIR